MELGFNLHIDQCNTSNVVLYICLMVIFVVLFISAKSILSKALNKDKKEENKSEDIKLLEQKRDGE